MPNIGSTMVICAAGQPSRSAARACAIARPTDPLTEASTSARPPASSTAAAVTACHSSIDSEKHSPVPPQGVMAGTP